MSKKVKNQHYVPKMYLRRFTSENNRFSVWNIMNDSILTRQRLENYAAKRYFYDTNEGELKKALRELINLYPNAESIVDYNDEQFVEKALSRLESAAATTIEMICKNHDSLYNENNIRIMIIFLHTLAYRSEKYRNMMESISDQMGTHLKNLGIDPNQVEGIELSAKDDQLFQIVGFSPLIKTVIQLMDNYDCYIGTVSEKMKLVISDNPAQGILTGFNDICIPLNNETAIIFRVKDPSAPIVSKDTPVGHEIRLSERSVYAYNAIQLSYANRFVFGDKDSLVFLKNMKRIANIQKYNHQKLQTPL